MPDRIVIVLDADSPSPHEISVESASADALIAHIEQTHSWDTARRAYVPAGEWLPGRGGIVETPDGDHAVMAGAKRDRVDWLLFRSNSAAYVGDMPSIAEYCDTWDDNDVIALAIEFALDHGRCVVTLDGLVETEEWHRREADRKRDESYEAGYNGEPLDP